MKLKYYLRGMGIGIILTAIVMGFALGGRRNAISDAEVIKRAKALGMVEGSAQVLTEISAEGESIYEEITPTSDTSLDEAGKEISQEVDETVTDTGEQVPGVVEEEEKTEDQAGEAEDPDVKGDAGETEVKSTETASAEEPKEDPQASDQAQALTESTEASAPVQEEAADTSSGGKTVTIPGGIGSEAVAALLVREGIIDNAADFNKFLCENRVDRVIRSGVKVIPEGASYEQIARIITQ